MNKMILLAASIPLLLLGCAQRKETDQAAHSTSSPLGSSPHIFKQLVSLSATGSNRAIKELYFSRNPLLGSLFVFHNTSFGDDGSITIISQKSRTTATLHRYNSLGKSRLLTEISAPQGTFFDRENSYYISANLSSPVVVQVTQKEAAKIRGRNIERNWSSLAFYSATGQLVRVLDLKKVIFSAGQQEKKKQAPDKAVGGTNIGITATQQDVCISLEWPPFLVGVNPQGQVLSVAKLNPPYFVSSNGDVISIENKITVDRDYFKQKRFDIQKVITRRDRRGKLLRKYECILDAKYLDSYIVGEDDEANIYLQCWAHTKSPMKDMALIKVAPDGSVSRALHFGDYLPFKNGYRFSGGSMVWENLENLNAISRIFVDKKKRVYAETLSRGKYQIWQAQLDEAQGGHNR